MYCEAGPVKIRLAARAVPDLDPGPLVGEHRQQPSAGSSRVRQNALIFRLYLVLLYTTLLEFTTSGDVHPVHARAHAATLLQWLHGYQ